MAKKISNALFWTIVIIAILSFLGVVYLIIKDVVEDSDSENALSGNAIAKTLTDASPSKVSACTFADHRNCEGGDIPGEVSGNECRRRGYTGGSQCKASSGRLSCECYSYAV